MGGLPSAGAEEAPPGEYQVKAAFLYNFAKFIEWPAPTFTTPGADFTIGVLGQNPFGPVLDQMLRDKQVQQRAVIIKSSPDISTLADCQLLFISASEAARLDQIMHAVQGHSILTVSEIEGFARRGGIIQLVTQASQIRFIINIDAAHRAGLQVSSQILKLATVMHDHPAAGE